MLSLEYGMEYDFFEKFLKICCSSWNYKKTQKTPREDIDLSIKRMNDFIKDYKKNEK
jgi:hypothetical protein